MLVSIGFDYLVKTGQMVKKKFDFPAEIIMLCFFKRKPSTEARTGL
jgi:hypothetical protein